MFCTGAGRRCAQLRGIKEEPEGRGTAAQLCTPSARASTELESVPKLKHQCEHRRGVATHAYAPISLGAAANKVRV